MMGLIFRSATFIRRPRRIGILFILILAMFFISELSIFLNHFFLSHLFRKDSVHFKPSDQYQRDETKQIARSCSCNEEGGMNTKGLNVTTVTESIQQKSLPILLWNTSIPMVKSNKTETENIISKLNVLPDDAYLSPNKSYFIQHQVVINHFVPKIEIQVKELCHPGRAPFLLIAIPSVWDHLDIRLSIRRTWASPLYGGKWPGRSIHHNVKLVFFLGKTQSENLTALREENALYGDIVQFEFVDHYKNLSIKIASILHWSLFYCDGVGHILKADEDTFVNLPLLLDLLNHMSSVRRFYMLGCRHWHEKPEVVRSGRWEETKQAYPFDFYPAYLYGHSYVISGDCIFALFSAYQRMPVVTSEDAYWTGILAKTVNVTRIHSDRFAASGTNDRCELVTDRHISQSEIHDVAEIYDLWRMVGTGKCR